MEKLIQALSQIQYRNVPCVHGGIMWVTDAEGWSHLTAVNGDDALKAGLVKKVIGSSCCHYAACTRCGKVLVEPERRAPGTITRPPQGWIMEEC